DPPLLPAMSGRVVIMLDSEHLDGPDGVTYCAMKFSGFLKLDSVVADALTRVMQAFSEDQMDRRVRRFFSHVAAVSRRAYDDPEGLAALLAGGVGGERRLPVRGPRAGQPSRVKRALLFTMEGNADGEAALAYFQARGVAVDMRDVGKDPDASLELFKRIRPPALVLDERVFLGFSAHKDDIEALVRE